MNRKNTVGSDESEAKSEIDRPDEKTTFHPNCLDDEALWEALRTGGGGGGGKDPDPP